MECRLCLGSVSEHSSVPIFGDENLAQESIWKCCQLQVTKDDRLPNAICLSCDSNLKSLMAFKTMSFQSDAKARQDLTACVNIKVEEVMLDDLVWENMDVAADDGANANNSDRPQPQEQQKTELQESSSSRSTGTISSVNAVMTLQGLYESISKRTLKTGMRDAAKIEKDNCLTTTTTAPELQNSSYTPYTNEEALALLIKCKMTEYTYTYMRKMERERNFFMCPSYSKIKRVKKLCYPPREHITIKEISFEIKLQAIVDHTIMRICKSQQDVLEQTLANIDDIELHMIFKWGCGGSSGQNMYHQNVSTEETDHSETDLFTLSIVPLLLYLRKESASSHKTILWQNPVPSSTRFCRPIKLVLKKETPTHTITEITKIEKQIGDLIPTVFHLGTKDIAVKSNLVLTMVDGKICSSITNESAQKCYICGAKPNQMSIVTFHDKRVDVNTHGFGLSSLRAYIRFFECLLHISCRLDVKRWQPRSVADKEKVAFKKSDIIKKFQQEMGLVVDHIIQGKVTSNDGNTARQFFKDPVKSGNITGIDVELISRFSTILSTISCGLAIDTTAFCCFTKETKNLYLKLYPWYCMPISVHKILVHGADFIESAILPIAQLSEEAQELRNEDFEDYTEDYMTKISRISIMENLLHRLLESSDPLISQLMSIPRQKGEILTPSVLQLLCKSGPSKNPNWTSDSSCDSD